MIISHQHKLVILSPWKTASQTIRVRLKDIDQSPYPKSFHFNPYLNRVVHQHLILSDFMCLPEASLGYRIAVFVRNPYDRVFSGFQQVMRDTQMQPRQKFPAEWIHQLVTQQIADNFEDLCMAGYDLNHWFAKLPAHKILECGRNTNLFLHPCHYWTHRLDQQAADFIGKVENFEEDFQRLCDTFNLTPVSNQSVNQTHIENLPASPNAYRYASLFHKDNVAKINAIFQRDFDLFDYATM
ncbi:sulfotransferase family 2 domain-containing protein [Undibacterium sp. Ji22W]|uniref:sulfotransferase family 2 domain-containing protein n=1 Tax=Undibacterium sp. Ji22W TaxID=3413038 RepID=UPI003BF34903